jgi:hypothetical protein
VGSFGGSGSLLKTKIIFVNEFSRSSVTMTVMTVVECLNKMVATAGLSLTLDPMGKMFQNASSLKPLRFETFFP